MYVTRMSIPDTVVDRNGSVVGASVSLGEGGVIRATGVTSISVSLSAKEQRRKCYKGSDLQAIKTRKSSPLKFE